MGKLGQMADWLSPLGQVTITVENAVRIYCKIRYIVYEKSGVCSYVKIFICSTRHMKRRWVSELDQVNFTVKTAPRIYRKTVEQDILYMRNQEFLQECVHM